jgi:hypothetical protein
MSDFEGRVGGEVNRSKFAVPPDAIPVPETEIRCSG